MADHDRTTADHVLKLLSEAHHKPRTEAIEHLRPLSDQALHQLRTSEGTDFPRDQAWLAIAVLLDALQAGHAVPDTLWQGAIEATTAWHNAID